MFDSETGLQNNLHRWYDPGTGRWISEDPIGFAAGDANLYRYVGNASTIYVDAMGLHRGLGNSYFENWIETQFSQARSGISDALRNVAEAANQAIAPVIAPIIAGFEEWKDYARRKGQWQSDRRWKLREGNLHLFEFNAQAGYGYRVTGTGESVTVVGHGFGQFEGKVAFVWGTKLVGRLNVRLQGTWTYVVCAPAAEWSIDAGINVSFSFGLQYKFGAVTRIGGASVTAEGGFGFSNFYSFKEKKWGEWKGTLYGRAYAEWKTGWWGSLRRREIRFTYGGELGID
jgi:RHS repeat-associated protein